MVKTEVTIAVHCPHCREPWFDREFARIADEQDAYPAVVDIKEITSRLRAMTVPPRTDIKANIRFHINLEQVKK
jgi:hypothetical protein